MASVKMVKMLFTEKKTETFHSESRKELKTNPKINSNCNYCARGELYHQDACGSVFLLTLMSEPSRDGQNTVVMRGGSQGEHKGARVRAAGYSRARERSGLPGI